MSTRNPKEEYNDDPVYYCKVCLSLKIRGDIANFEYCDECGSTDIGTCTIEQWEEMYKESKGYSYLKH